MDKITDGFRSYNFFISTLPTAKQGGKVRTRRIITKTGKTAHVSSVYQPKSIENAAGSIAAQLVSQLPRDYELMSESVFIKKLVFVFPPNSSFSKKRLEALKWAWRNKIQFVYIDYKTTKPDIDNLEKLFYDAAKGVLYTDDNIICRKNDIFKCYGLKSGIYVEITGK